MTTEERIAVMEECAKLECSSCQAGRRMFKDALGDWRHSYGEGSHPCSASYIREEIARLRRTLEPPTAEEWRDCVDYVLTHGTDSEHNLRALLQRADRAKGAK